MSYILDALKRAERERKQGQLSVLDEIPSAAAGAGAPRRRLPAVWLLVVVAVALAGLVYGVLSWRHKGGTPNGAPAVAARGPTPAPAASFPPPSVATPPAAAPQAAAPPPQAPTATIEDGGRIATLDDVAPPPPPQTLPAPPEHPPFQKAMPPMPGPRAMPPPAAGAPPPAEGPNAVQAGTPAAEGAPPILPAPADNAAAALQAADNAPQTAPAMPQAGTPAEAGPAPAPAGGDTVQHSLKQMPEGYRANFPAFSVDVHAYNDDPQRRFVLIGGKRYREGDTLAEGPRLVSIVPEGLVLEWQGQQVLYPVGR